MRAIVATVLLAGAAAAQTDANWPSFRGPGASGVAEGNATPVEWDVAAGRNIRWKTPIPGLSHSSPIVWGDRIFLTTAVDQSGTPELRVGLFGDISEAEGDGPQEWKVLCLDKNTGEILWERTAHTGAPRMPRHTKSTHANPTAATDGTHVVAFFGSEGLYCYDFDGKLLWKKDLGALESNFYTVPEVRWGFASSPVIHGGKVFVQADVKEDSFLAAFAVDDGSEVWRVARDDVPTWSTPTAVQDAERTQVIVNGFRHTGGYDADTGNELWRFRGGGDIPIPTPVAAHGKVYLTSAHGPQSPVYAFRLDASGDISLAEGETANQGVAWSTPRGGSYTATPLVYGDYLYVPRWNGVLACHVAETGSLVYEERLGTGAAISASPVASGGKIYVPTEDGDVYVVRAGGEFTVLATNSMDETVLATPAISGGTVYFRTRSHVVAIGE